MPDSSRSTEATDALGTFLGERRTPLVPTEAACFPPEAGVDHGAWYDELRSALQDYRRQAAKDPFSNPVEMLALDISERLDSGSLSCSAMEQLIHHATVMAYGARAERLRSYLDQPDAAADDAHVEALIRGMAEPGPTDDESRDLVPFEVFKSRIERELFGIVITAHPTFSLSAGLLRNLAMLATACDGDGTPLSPEQRARIYEDACAVEHRPDAALNLAFEHKLSLEVIGNIRSALGALYDRAFRVAASLYPDRWLELNPKLLTIATWVGYDLDGRSDIPWSDSLFKRLGVQALQMRRYRDAVAGIREDHAAGTDDVDLRHTLELVESRLSLAIREVEEEINGLQAHAPTGDDWHERVRAIAKRMHEGRKLRLIDSEPLVERLERAIGLAHGEDAKRRLCVLRAELVNHGLSLAHMHVRLNAMQLHNAVRKLIGIDGAPDDPARRRSHLAAITELIDKVDPVTINFGSMLAEQASAKRLFMLVAQIIKYVDATTPVRFLIAECESPFTLLTALYYARLFGVERQVDISPLFETIRAFERGPEVIEGALANPHYRAYVRARGRICIQTGYSDAGRYLGQTAAAMAIERLKIRVGALLAEQGLDDIELVVFDTHGESMGRGSHPASFADRLQYTASPASRISIAANGVALKEEMSFQGGDGWIYFLTVPAARATIARIVDHALAPVPRETDPYYAEGDYVSEYATAIRQFNERVLADPAYPTLLDCFGTNLFYPSGSRALKRQTDGAGGGHVDLVDPSQLRAIPHNAILQQLGLLANSLGGLGQAIRNDPDSFHALLADSPRFRRLVGLAAGAMKVSDPDILAAYAATVDPGHWLARAAESDDSVRFEELRGVATLLEHDGRYARMEGLLRTFVTDWLDLTRNLARHPEFMVEDTDRRDMLQILHGVRIALIQRIFLLTTHIPSFRPQHGISHEQLVARVLHLDIEETDRLLTMIFPKTDPNIDLALNDFGEPATYESESAQSYEQEHLKVFQPIANLYALTRRIGAAIIHTVGATG